jgi:hypothetical protein
MLQGLGNIPQYNNDEQIDNQLRSVLFQVPVSDNPTCLDGPTLPACFDGVVDLGAIDIERARDHGMPSYNQMRQAYGLSTKSSFTAITGESTESFPSDPQLTAGSEISDPDSLDFTSLRDIDGANVDLNDPNASARTATDGTRRTTLAARMKAIYTNTNNVDAFTGMLAEPHVANTDIPASQLASNVFLVPDAALPAAACKVTYTIEDVWNGGFHAHMGIQNLGTTAINGWTLRFRFANGQTFTWEWDAWFNVSNSQVTGDDDTWNESIPAGGTIPDVAFDATWDNYTNSKPVWITLNNKRCSIA